jgi:hypothetical protein
MMKRLLKYAVKEGCSMTLVPFSGVIPWYESLGFSKTCDKFVLVFHNHGTRKQAKYIKALDEEGKKPWAFEWFYTRNEYRPNNSISYKIGISSGQ